MIFLETHKVGDNLFSLATVDSRNNVRRPIMQETDGMGDGSGAIKIKVEASQQHGGRVEENLQLS